MSGRSVLFMSQTGRTLGTWNIAEVTGIRGNKVVDKEIKMGNRLTGYARGRCVLSANEVLKNCTRMEPPRLASEYPGT